MKKKKIKNKYMLGIFALAVVAVLGVGLAVASPLGKGFGFGNDQNLTASEKTAMHESPLLSRVGQDATEHPFPSQNRTCPIKAYGSSFYHSLAY